MTSGKIAEANVTGHVLSSFKIMPFCYSQYVMSIKYGFVLSILIVNLGDYHAARAQISLNIGLISGHRYMYTDVTRA